MTNKDRIKTLLDLMILSNSSIGAHGITFREDLGTSEDLKEKAEKITEEGIKVSSRNGANFASTCQIFGNKDEYDQERLIEYFYGSIAISVDGQYKTVIVAIPQTMTDLEDREYFLGKFPEGMEKDDESYRPFPINEYFMEKGYVPKEFVVGYISGEIGQKPEESFFKFTHNPNYIGTKAPNQRKQFFESIKQDLLKHGLREITPEIVDEIDPADLYPQFGLDKSKYLEQAKDYARQKYNIRTK